MDWSPREVCGEMEVGESGRGQQVGGGGLGGVGGIREPGGGGVSGELSEGAVAALGGGRRSRGPSG